MVEHVVMRREDYVGGTHERPEVGSFTQARPPDPWDRIAVGDPSGWSGVADRSSLRPRPRIPPAGQLSSGSAEIDDPWLSAARSSRDYWS